MRILLASAITVLYFLETSCGAPGEDIDSTVRGPDTLVLSVVDTIGIEMGDSAYMFGSVSGAAFAPDGSILVCDMVSADIRAFSREGTFLRRMGGRGSGPGELVMPTSMAVTPTGRVIVSDMYAGGVHSFSPDGSWEGLLIDYAGQQTPHEIMAIDDSSFSGSLIDFEPEYNGEEGQFFVMRIGRFTDSILPDEVYFENAILFDPEDLTGLMRETAMGYSFTSDINGNLYVAPTNSEEYRIDCYRPDGELYMQIENSFQRVEKKTRELEIERDFVNNTLQAMGSQGVVFDFEPDIYRDMIGYLGLSVDGEGRLWVRRGTEETVTFDIYDQEGNWILVATVDGLAAEETSMMICRVFDAGILAYSLAPESYQKLYLIE